MTKLGRPWLTSAHDRLILHFINKETKSIIMFSPFTQIVFLLFYLQAARTSNAIIHPVITQHSLLQHTVVSRVTADDLECAFMCIKHSLCYSFNFHAPTRLCELSNATKADHLKDFVYDHSSAYNELIFV